LGCLDEKEPVVASSSSKRPSTAPAGPLDAEILNVSSSDGRG